MQPNQGHDLNTTKLKHKKSSAVHCFVTAWPLSVRASEIKAQCSGVYLIWYCWTDYIGWRKNHPWIGHPHLTYYKDRYLHINPNAGALLARNWFKKNDEFDLKWIGGMKIGPKVYGKQESVKSQDFPPGGKIRSKMAPVNKKILKVPEIKN